MNRIVLVTLVLLAIGCSATPEKIELRGDRVPTDQVLGRRVVAIGMAADAKQGACVLIGPQKHPVFLDGLERWPREIRRQEVRVDGVLRKRIHPPLERDASGQIIAGGPQGEDYYLTDVTYSVVGP